MQARNAEKLKQLDAAIEAAVKEHGESEIRDAWNAKADYLCRIGDKVRRQPSAHWGAHAGVRTDPAPGRLRRRPADELLLIRGRNGRRCYSRRAHYLRIV